MVVLATEARKVSVEDAISLDRAVRFGENAGGRSGNSPLEACVSGAQSNAEDAKGKMKRAVGVPGENWIRRLSRTGRWQTTQPRRTSADQQGSLFSSRVSLFAVVTLRVHL